MKIELKCGEVYKFHQYRRFRSITKEGVSLLYVELQESPGRRWQSVYLFPRTLVSTDIPEMKVFMEWKVAVLNVEI